MTIDTIYEQIALLIQNGLNAASDVFEFSIKTMYNEQRPDNPNIYVGTLSYTSADIIPLAGINVLELNGSVSFVVKKEQAAEINAVLQGWLESQKGVVSQIGSYTCIPTYETTSRGSVDLTGQTGETITLSFFAKWQLVEGALLMNNSVTTLDGATLPVLSKKIAKVKNAPSDNQAGSAVLQAQTETQSLAFEYTAFLTSTFNNILSEIMNIDVTALQQVHTLNEQIGTINNTYNVVMQNGTIVGEIGGVFMVQLYFIISRPATG